MGGVGGIPPHAKALHKESVSSSAECKPPQRKRAREGATLSRLRSLRLQCARLLTLAFLAAFCWSLTGTQAAALGGIRDAELENLLRSYGEPIFAAAGLQPEAVKIHLVNDSRLNAFVANGQQIYIFAGLLEQFPAPEMLIGIIAHETAHLAGGHLPRTADALQRAQYPILISTLLGIGAVAAGAGDAGAAIIAAGQTLGERGFLSYSRAQEAAADQAALRYLEAAGESAHGLLEVFALFAVEERAAGVQSGDSYASSHPLSYERHAALETGARESPHWMKPTSPQRQMSYDLAKAKLRGFLDDPEHTMRRYPADNQSEPALYARAVAHYKRGDTDKAVAEMETLTSRHPDNPWFHELLGQILLEGGRIEEAIAAYGRAAELAPREPLVLTALGTALVAVERDDANRQAIEVLQQAIGLDAANPIALRQLAFAYARAGRIGWAELATAERALLLGDREQAGVHARRAMGRLEENSPPWRRAQDIESRTSAQP